MTHPINDFISTSMKSIKEMVDVNTIVGDAVATPDGMVIIPISKVSFGFATGGGDLQGIKEDGYEETTNIPLAGGSGAGISINPIAFLVVGQGNIKLMSLDSHNTIDKILDIAPNIITKICEVVDTNKQEKKGNNSNNIN